MLWLLLPVLLLVYLLYRRRAPRARPWAGVWLWKRGRARRFRPRLDLRLLLLLLGAALMVLALEDPPLAPSPLVLVVDASASMAALPVATPATSLPHAIAKFAPMAAITAGLLSSATAQA